MRQKNKELECSFDSQFNESEQLPRNFTINFESVTADNQLKTRVFYDGKQLGDVIDDNSKTNDYYRFHDVFHFSFAAMLGWSPCTRAMMRRKRKSNEATDQFEDGARATITEEALSMIIFNEAKRKNYFEGTYKVSKTTLRIIKEMTENFEVNVRTAKEWERAIMKSYEIFRFLVANGSGTVKFDSTEKVITYSVPIDKKVSKIIKH